jgi:replicative DNA helicase
MSAVARRVPALPRLSNIRDLVGDVTSITELRTEYPELRGVSLGLPELDKLLSGAFAPGRLCVICGGSGTGKTVFAVQVLAACAHQQPVLHFSFEDGEEDTAQRMLANLGRVDVGGIRNGFTSGTIPASLYEAAVDISKLPITVCELPTDAVGIARTMFNWSRSQNIVPGIGGTVIIDQLSHILPTYIDAAIEQRLIARGMPLPPGPRAPEHDVYEWQISFIREAAKQFGLNVIVLHQLNTKVSSTTGRPTAESVRGSQGIVHKADSVLVPWRPKSIPNPDPFGGPGQPATIPAPPNCAEIICLKGRQIEGGWVHQMVFDGAHQAFLEVGDDGSKYRKAEPFSPRAIEAAAKLTDLRNSIQERKAHAAGTAAPQLAAAVDVTSP